MNAVECMAALVLGGIMVGSVILGRGDLDLFYNITAEDLLD